MSEKKDKIYQEGIKKWAFSGTQREFFLFLIKAISLVTKTINGSPIITDVEGEDMTINSGGSNSYFPSGW